MTKKTTKNFSIFWLAAGIIWVVATIRHIIIKDDVVGTIIYITAGVLSFILAFAYYKSFIK